MRTARRNSSSNWFESKFLTISEWQECDLTVLGSLLTAGMI